MLRDLPAAGKPVSVVASVQGVLPPNRYSQDEIVDMFLTKPEFAGHDAIARKIFRGAKVDHRNLVFPMERYRTLTEFSEANDLFIENAIELGCAAIQSALDEAGLAPTDVDLIMSTTVTGIMVPSLEARIANRLGFRPDIRRIPMFGLGCVAGAAGMARVGDFLRGAPDSVAVLLSVELCSLTFTAVEPTIVGLVGTALFGDGAAAVVMVGERRAEKIGASGPVVVDSRSHLYPDSERALGWDVGPNGLQLVLSVDVPDVLGRYLRGDVSGFLSEHELTIDDICTWVVHPGGPKVIEAVVDSLGIPDSAVELTWRSLADIGNLSSSSVLHVLRDTIAKHPPSGPGVLMAMGPGFSSELVLLHWA